MGGAPLWLSGPMPIDTAVGMDSLVNAMGVAIAAQVGGDLFCSVTDKEHYAMPTPEDTAKAINVLHVAFEVASVARGSIVAFEKNNRMAEARTLNDWNTQVVESVIPELARNEFEKYNLTKTGKSCTICGPYCPHLLVNINARK